MSLPKPELELSSDLDEIVRRLEIAVQKRLGENATVANISVATLGGSSRTILFDLVDGSSWQRLVSRQETYLLDASPFLPPEMQFKLLQLAYKHGVPVPEPIFEFVDEDGLGRGHIMAHVAGETLPKRLLQDPQYAYARANFVGQAADILVRLHAIDKQEAAFLDDTLDSVDPLQAQIERYDYYGEPHPALDYGFRWLEQHRPAKPAHCLVHGDFRNGNMLVDKDGIQAVLDWECAHIGDPMADLGWLCTRSWRFGNDELHAGGFGTRASLFDAYEAAGGRTVDREAVHWWEIFGSMRWAMLNIMQIHGHLHGGRRSPAFAACGRNASLMEYDLLMTIADRLD
ncbi:MAG: aminoglycoside phosphotransferase (APT) family kinase protein [Gammaproteobacteria bacterium]|jgi:aminoglycoside phosphotransferase (APT) family kinase protein